LRIFIKSFFLLHHSPKVRNPFQLRQHLCLIMAKIAIIGAGFVGSTAAYALFLKKVCSTIALIDISKEKAEGEAMDLEQGMLFVPGTHFSYGSSYEQCKDADIVVITAGLAQKKGETRLDLVRKNAAILKEMVPKIVEHNKSCIIILVTNPVDIMTYLTIKYSGFPKERVFGTGTTLDTARLRYYLGEYLNLSPQSVHAYIMGEHGDSEFPVWSAAAVGGLRIDNMHGWSAEAGESCFQKTKNAAYEIINRKGATYYAIALVIADICEAILSDEGKIFPLSTYLENYYDEGDVCLSVPCALGKEGIRRRIQLPLNDSEQQALHKSAGVLKGIIKDIGE